MGWFKRKDLTLEQALEYSKGKPSRLSWWITRKIWYKHDSDQWGVKEYWQTWEQTLALRTGDCEDFAIVAHEVLTRMGLSPYIVCVEYWKGYQRVNDGHAVCAYYNKDRQKWYYIGTEGHKKCGATIQSVAERVSPDAKIMELRKPDKTLLEKHVKVGGDWRQTL